MSDWSGRKQHHSAHFTRNHQVNSSVSPFGNNNLSHDPRHHSAPFSSFPSSSGDIDEVDECCSYIGKLLIHEAPSQHRSRQHLSRQPEYSEVNPKYAPAASKPGTMTIGHHHYSNRHHHYPYHDHYHDDSPMLPRIEFPSSQFDRLLRGSPSLDRSSDTASTRFTSSSRDSSSSTSLSSSSSSSSSSPFSSSNSSSSSRHASWKSGPFDSRKK